MSKRRSQITIEGETYFHSTVLEAAERERDQAAALATRNAQDAQAARRERDRYRNALEQIAHGDWLLARASEEVARVRGIARAALATPDTPPDA